MDHALPLPSPPTSPISETVRPSDTGVLSRLDNGRLRIGLVASPSVPVPPVDYGGTELVIDLLARGLRAAGHDVTLFATGDSTCPVERHWLHDRALGTTGDVGAELGHVEAAYDVLSPTVDLIHDHTLLGPLWATATESETPVVSTVHGPFTPMMVKHYERLGDRVGIIAISDHQRSTAPSVPVVGTVHHGIDVDSIPFGRGDGGYVLFLGRMSPDKGVHRAIEIARKAGRRLLIAAKMWEPAERSYFDDVVEPMLGPDAVYVGQVDGTRKRDLLAQAEALVNPIQWPEPFGLVMIEALAAGTPVVSFPEGAAPEIVAHGVTGFLCPDDEDMARMLGQVDSLDRRACRLAARSRFSTAEMVRNHVAIYRRQLSGAASAGALGGPWRRSPAPQLAAAGDVP